MPAPNKKKVTMLGDAAKRVEYIAQNINDEAGYRSLLTTVGTLLYATGHDEEAGNFLQAAQHRQFRLEEILDIVRPVGDTPFDKFVPWVFREFMRLSDAGERGFIDAANAFAAVAPQMAAWQKKTRVDVNRMRLAEVTAALEAWVEANARTPAIPGEVVYRFPDGWTVQQLLTKEQILDEGHVMQHCMRDPSKQYYERTAPTCDTTLVTLGWIRLYSLRDPKGVSHVTMLQSVDRGTFDEVRGLGNKPTRPEHQPYVDEFIASGRRPSGFGYRRSRHYGY